MKYTPIPAQHRKSNRSNITSEIFDNEKDGLCGATSYKIKQMECKFYIQIPELFLNIFGKQKYFLKDHFTSYNFLEDRLTLHYN